MAKTTIRHFKDLQTWQEAQALAEAVYKVTAAFRESEKFGLSNQLRRAAVSISSNIAEGFSRQSKREKTQFYHIAKGSLTEVESQIDLAGRIGYLTSSQCGEIEKRITSAGRLTTALLRSIPE